MNQVSIQELVKGIDHDIPDALVDVVSSLAFTGVVMKACDIEPDFPHLMDAYDRNAGVPLGTTRKLITKRCAGAASARVYLSCITDELREVLTHKD